MSNGQQDQSLKDRLVEALRTVRDPEIPVNIYDLGLIYRLDVDDQGVVLVEMTLTAPACPVAGILPRQVGDVIDQVPGVTDATVRLVWDPPWSQERMSDEALLELNLV
ncbi:MAG: SUF system Fe-S cluster assembly protein [Candidatus Thiodiazotropha sp.]|jgi:FeS assembly SUF system protein